MVVCLIDTSAPVPARQMAATLFSNTILNKTQEPELEGLWQNLEVEKREGIKEEILSLLADTNPTIRRATASDVASIAAIELPHDQWAELIPMLAENASHENLDVRKASVQTLGYICEEMEGQPFKQDQLELILSAVIKNIDNGDSDSEIIEICINAILFTIEFTKQIFENNQGRIIVDQILKCITFQDDAEVRVAAFQCIGEIVERFYPQLDQFFSDFKAASLQAMASDDEENVKKQAIEMWTRLGEEELFRKRFNNGSKGYIQGCYQEIIEPILGCIFNIEADDESSFDATTIDASRAACISLQTLGTVLEGQLSEPVFKFIMANLHPEKSWKEQFASMLCIASLIEAETAELSIEPTKEVYPLVYTLMTHESSELVRKTAAWVASKICRHCSQIFDSQEMLESLFKVAISGIQSEGSHIACMMLEIIRNMAWNFSPHMDTNFFSLYIEDTLNLVLNFAYLRP